MNKFFSCCVSLMIAMTAMADEWTLVTDPADLQAGDQIVLACNTQKATAGTFDETKGILTSITSTFGDKNSTITSLGEGTVVLTLGGKAGAWTFTLDGKLIGTAAAKKLQLDKGTTTWTISIIGGDATIASTNTDYGTIQYNKNSPRFLNYTSNQTAIQIYRAGSSAPQVAISYQGFPYRKTLCEEPTYEAGTVLTLPTATPTVGGKTLTAWTYGGQTYLPGATFTVPETDVVFVPVWDGGTGVENANTESLKAKGRKILRDGQLIILHNGVEYNAQGIRLQ